MLFGWGFLDGWSVDGVFVAGALFSAPVRDGVSCRRCVLFDHMGKSHWWDIFNEWNALGLFLLCYQKLQK